MANVDIINRALAEIGSRSQVSDPLDPDESEEARYADLLYDGLRDFMLREGDYDFALQNAAAVATTGGASPWTLAYTYPSGAVRIRQLVPTSLVVLDPRPVVWTVASVSNVLKIFTNEAITRIIYTGTPSETVWDSIFTESYVRLLGSALAFALQNKIEASKEKLGEALNFAGIANLRVG